MQWNVLLLEVQVDIKFIPKAADAAAWNQGIVLQELPVLSPERTKKVTVFYSAVWAGLRCAWLYRGEGGTEIGNKIKASKCKCRWRGKLL